MRKLFRVFLNLINPRTSKLTFLSLLKEISQRLELFYSRQSGFKKAQKVRIRRVINFDASTADYFIRSLSTAEKIVNGEFFVFGRWFSFRKNIPWHEDFLRGYKFSPTLYFKESLREIGQGRDIKVPWELSRFLFLPQLALAYCLTKKDEFRKTFENLILDWIEKNPWKFGPNWSIAMEVSIRACNWLLAYDLFVSAGARFSKEFEKKFKDSLLKHGKHIFANLEWSPYLNTNHYLSNLVGLFYLGVYLSELKIARKWLKFALTELEKEIENQVRKDGMDFEGSTFYHRLVQEMFLYPFILGKLTGIEFSRSYAEKLKKMADFTLHVVKNDGTAPQIGDNDSGRLHSFTDRPINDFSYLLSLSAVALKDESFAVKEFDIAPEVFVFFGSKAKDIWQKFSKRSVKKLNSKVFLESGIAVLRKEDDYLIVSAGPLGQKGRGGHDHNDRLSFELRVKGKDFFVDPGTGVYTPDPILCRKMQSTKSHNTVSINGVEQNTFSEEDVWTKKNETEARILHFEEDSKKALLVAEHSGYRKLSDGLVHKREFLFSKENNNWKITDFIGGRGRFDIQWTFVLHPEVEIEDVNPDRIILKNDSVKICLSYDNSLELRIEGAFYSPEYSVLTETKRLVFEKSAELPLKISFEISLI